MLLTCKTPGLSGRGKGGTELRHASGANTEMQHVDDQLRYDHDHVIVRIHRGSARPIFTGEKAPRTSVGEARQPPTAGGDRKTRRVHDHGEVGVVAVDAGDIQNTNLAKRVNARSYVASETHLLRCNSIVKS